MWANYRFSAIEFAMFSKRNETINWIKAHNPAITIKLKSKNPSRGKNTTRSRTKFIFVSIRQPATAKKKKTTNEFIIMLYHRIDGWLDGWLAGCMNPCKYFMHRFVYVMCWFCWFKVAFVSSKFDCFAFENCMIKKQNHDERVSKQRIIIFVIIKWFLFVVVVVSTILPMCWLNDERKEQ